MKIIVAKNEFEDALKILMKAVAVKAQTPILSGIYFSAQNSYLEMQATDNQVGIISKVPANVEEDGETVIIGKKLFEIVQKMTGEVVTISTEDNCAKILSAGSNFKLLTFKPEDFPKIKQEENLQKVNLRQFALKKMIKQTAFAADNLKELTRPIFAGVLFDFADKKIRLAATNTHRLAVATDNLPESVENFQFIVPAKILQDISAMLNDTGKIEINYTGKSANFIFDNLFVSVRLIAGNFPNFERLLNEEKTKFAKVVREEFLQALERVAVIGKETMYRTVDLLFDDDIKISSTSPEIGTAEENVVAVIEGGELDISFNYNYLTDALKVIDADKIQIGLTETLKPIEIKPVDNESFKYIVTPVRMA